MFQIGNFINDNNEVVKIIGIHSKNHQINTDKHGLIRPCSPNITLNKEVLSSCGFTLNPSSGLYEIKLKNGNIVSCTVGQSGVISNLTICCPFYKHHDDIGVLSILQDIIRDKTGEELPIDIPALQKTQKF